MHFPHPRPDDRGSSAGSAFSKPGSTLTPARQVTRQHAHYIIAKATYRPASLLCMSTTRRQCTQLANNITAKGVVYQSRTIAKRCPNASSSTQPSRKGQTHLSTSAPYRLLSQALPALVVPLATSTWRRCTTASAAGPLLVLTGSQMTASS